MNIRRKGIYALFSFISLLIILIGSGESETVSIGVQFAIGVFGLAGFALFAWLAGGFKDRSDFF